MTTKKLFLSTIKRGSQKHQITGHLFNLDPTTFHITKKVDIPEPTTKKGFWNPRGGNRGARGITVHNNILYVATATRIRKYDLNLNYLGEIQNKRFAGLHNIHANSSGIVALSTIHDLVVKVDYSGNTLWEWHGHKSKLLQKTFKFAPRKIDYNIYNKNNAAMDNYLKEDRLHLSGSCIHNNKLLILSGRKNFVVEIVAPNKENVYMHDRTLAAAHDIVWVNNLMYVNNTRNQSISVYNNGKHIKVINTKMYDATRKIDQFATAGWQRGLHKYDNDHLLVGTSPLTVFLLNIRTGKIPHKWKLDNDIKHCSYSLLLH
jgi:hypothetical protein